MLRILLASAFSAAALFVGARECTAEYPLRVATYNIYYLKQSVSNARVANLKQVIAVLEADVIGLQEIADRGALERVFDPNDWTIVIDDDSGDAQDLAVVVKKPLVVKRQDGQAFTDYDADDQDFLFPGPQFESVYRNRRDALCVLVNTPNNQGGFHFIVNHWKSRLGGRDTTDPIREEAGRLLASKLEHEFDGKNVIILGDFNDNPDDKSMNILETGNPTAIGGPEQQHGPLLVNVGDELVANDYVSWGSFVQNGQLVNQIPGSQDQNNATRGSAGSAKPILFDQILFPLHMQDQYVPGSAAVFGDPVARQGTGTNGSTPSDHIPVYADFVIRNLDDPEPPPGPGPALRIAELMPNPDGDDAGNEWVLLKNPSGSAVDLAGWKLRDRSQNDWSISGTVPANGTLKLIDLANAMPLNNNGDEVVLLSAQGMAVHRAQYVRADVRSGQAIAIP